jgi:hypothetical protein
MLTDKQARILERMLSHDFYLSPLKFALWAYPWGEGNLKKFDGPRKWQRDVMLEIEGYLTDGIGKKAGGERLADFFREAIASGRGPGKSALLGMLAHWFISTRIGSSTWVAANGEPQLRTKTFPEIAKWVAMGINAEFFDTNAMSIQPATWFRNYIESPEGLGRSAQYYYISGQLWSEERPDSFAGAHNWDGEFAIFDEASGIPDSIWGVQEGVFTEDIVDRFWLAFSNPRKNQGAFFECFNKNRDLWRTKQIDSRTVEGISHSTYENIIAQYGEDSNEARIEVYGQFPHVGDNQFIGPALVDEAIDRVRYEDQNAPTIIGVDVARFGDDSTVIAVRKGRDLVSVQRFNGLDTMQVVGRVIEAIGRFDPDLTVIDEGGLGAGVLDRLKEQRYKVRGVNFGSRADNSMYLNKRAEMWGEMKEWLKTASIGYTGPTRKQDNQRMKSDLCGPTYKVNSVGAIVLEAKDAMKKRGLASPDCADGLAVTFAYPVAARHVAKEVTRRSSFKGFLSNAAGSWMN